MLWVGLAVLPRHRRGPPAAAARRAGAPARAGPGVHVASGEHHGHTAGGPKLLPKWNADLGCTPEARSVASRERVARNAVEVSSRWWRV